MILNSIMRKFQRPGGPPQESGALRDRQGGPPDWVLPGATIDMWFAKSVYFGASPDNLSVVRASLGYGDDETGRWVQFGNDVARITAKGLLIEDGCSNVVLWCRDLTNAVWSVTGITTAKNQAGFDGTAAGASSLTATAANATILQRITDPKLSLMPVL
jgi:hypothetical protein